jgi:hypothetical protein
VWFSYLFCCFLLSPERLVFPHGATAPSGPGPSHCRVFTITLKHTTLGTTPLDEWSARRRDLYLTTHNTHKRQTSIPTTGFELEIPASKRPQTHALHRTAIGIGDRNHYISIKSWTSVWQLVCEPQSTNYCRGMPGIRLEDNKLLLCWWLCRKTYLKFNLKCWGHYHLGRSQGTAMNLSLSKSCLDHIPSSEETFCVSLCLGYVAVEVW